MISLNIFDKWKEFFLADKKGQIQITYIQLKNKHANYKYILVDNKGKIQMKIWFIWTDICKYEYKCLSHTAVVWYRGSVV